MLIPEVDFADIFICKVNVKAALPFGRKKRPVSISPTGQCSFIGFRFLHMYLAVIMCFRRPFRAP